MAFQLYVSNSLTSLSTQLNKNFKALVPSVFLSHHVVVQTEGMSNWLKGQVVSQSEYEIAANIRFLTPTDILQKAYQLLGGSYTTTYSPGNLCWLIFKILGEMDFNRMFPSIAAYYDAQGNDGDVRRLALAEKLADLFDQYQVYRPDYIQRWNGSSSAGVQEDEWQQYVWIRLKELYGQKLSDKIHQGSFILEQLQKTEQVKALITHMPDVHVFGISIIAPYHLQIFRALAEYINISFYFLNPAPYQYWYDTVSEKQLAALTRKGVAEPHELSVGNTLLTCWGKVIKDTFNLLFEYDELLNSFTDVGVREPLAGSLLQKIQQDIFHNRCTVQRVPLAAKELEDGSITINACYTIAREVECLYNYLVRLVDRGAEPLSARDIVVMVSDIDAYAPYIKAVFNNAPYRFNFTIADEGYTSSDNAIYALKALLELGEEDFKAERVLQLLDIACIRRRFGLSDVALIRRIVDKANIRFGIDGSKDNDTVYVSWKYGLQRILYGICMSGGEEYRVGEESIFPLDLLEGSASQELIRFGHMVQVIMHSLEERKIARTIEEWVEYVKWVTHNLVYEAGESFNEDYNVLLEQLRKYNVLSGIVAEPLSYEVFCRHFLNTVSATTRSAAFAGGGITFCTLIPMRSLPFKIVAMLGLNFDKFPRKEMTASFDLMKKEERDGTGKVTTGRRGDRNVKENDKHLFLETLLSAQQNLYISYLGRSVKDNTVLPPSALVDELLDYIEAVSPECADVRKTMVTVQPLHSFSRRYAEGKGSLYNYLIQDEVKGAGLVDLEKEPKVFKPEEITLGSLVSFFKNPFKAYYNQVLDINYDDEEVLLNETELFELDNLQQWSLKQDLLLIDSGEWDAFKNRLVKTGKLPLKNMAEVCLQDLEEAVSPVRLQWKHTVGDTTPSVVHIEIPLESTVVTGTLKGVHDKSLVFICFSKSERKYLMEAYIQYLAGRASGIIERLCFISSVNDVVYEAAPLTGSEARIRLQQLVDHYIKGHGQLLAFYPDFKVEPADVPGLERDRFLKVIEDKINHYNYPLTDKYILQEYGNGFFGEEKSFADFKAICQILVTPLAEIFPSAFN